jgi:ABC-type polysaccharide/polyol phosphate export permease
MTQRHLGPEVGRPTQPGPDDPGRANPAPDEDDWVVSPAPRSAPAYRAKELWAYREMVVFLAVRDLQVRYKQAAFGVLWAVLQPLAGAAVFVVVFSRLANISSDGLPYLLFAFLGYAVWTYFAASMSSANASLVTNSALVTKVYFPRLAAPLSAVLPGLVDLLIAFSMTAILMVLFGVAPGWQLLTLPFWLVCVTLLAFGIGTLLATLNVKYRDAHFAVGLLTQLWLFASPVAYPSSLVPERWQIAYHLNPMAGVLEGFRWAVLDGRPPGRAALLSLLVGGLLLCAGVAYFTRSERRFADVI